MQLSKQNKVWLGLTVALTLQGCATALLSQAPVTTSTTERSLFARDTIRMIATPSDDADGMVLLGDKYSYHLTTGAKNVRDVASKLNPKYIEMENTTDLRLFPDNKFSGAIKFKYESKNSLYSSLEEDTLKNICMKRVRTDTWFGLGKHTYYECGFSVRGGLYINQASTFSQATKLSKGRNVSLNVIGKTTTNTDPFKVADKLFALPFTLMFDAVTLPLQLISISASKN